MTTEELKAILDAKEPPVVVNADGTCRPLTYDELQAALAAAQEERDRLRQENAELRDRLASIKRHWQDGIGTCDNPWRLRMAELIGDEEGISEAHAEKPLPSGHPVRK